jgi:hypothetical protein
MRRCRSRGCTNLVQARNADARQPRWQPRLWDTQYNSGSGNNSNNSDNSDSNYRRPHATLLDYLSLSDQ